MTLGNLVRVLGSYLGWFGPVVLLFTLLVASARSWALLRKGRTWFAWIGGLTAILALWVLVACWLFVFFLAEGDVGPVTAPYILWIIFSIPALLIELVVFSGLFLGLRSLWRRRAAGSEGRVNPTA
ncbi:MAG TPA: hypothetical protein VIH26_01895 [Anaerolineales bacterium]